ncbi:MAG: SWIM zinc finger family protein [Anaerolineae bacterium]|nr:SWIM zinc finger family protein [Anaerolineae bacterium]
MAKRGWSYYESYWPRYEPTRPIEVKDGIKAKSQRGEFVKNWWADRWIGALTLLMDPGRLSRGRSYARRGQVIEINIAPGHVTSRVQGSRPTPYKVNIRLKPLDDSQWNQVFDALAEQAIFAAQLLNGEMPPDIEQVFEAVKVPLFPTSKGDLQTECSCPDWANPCKHIAAVYYLLGERFDEDPFLLFELRGRSKEMIAAALRERRAQELEEAGEMPSTFEAVEAVQASALGECLDRYWALNAEVADLALNISYPQVGMALLKRLGVPDFLEEGFAALMARIYDGVTSRALEVAFADSARPE